MILCLQLIDTVSDVVTVTDFMNYRPETAFEQLETESTDNVYRRRRL